MIGLIRDNTPWYESPSTSMFTQRESTPSGPSLAKIMFTESPFLEQSHIGS